MKKLIVLLFAALFLTACPSRQEQTNLKDALNAKLQDDQDLKDYKINPADITDCVVDAIGSSLPGLPGDPRHARYYQAYAKFLSVKSETEVESAMKEFKDLFGSEKAARTAAVSVTDHIMTCMGDAISRRGDVDE